MPAHSPRDALVVPPNALQAHRLRDEVAAASSAACPPLAGTRVPSHALAGQRVAVWRLPPLEALAVYHWLRQRGAVPTFLNDRWTVADVADIVLRLRCAVLVVPPSTPSSALPPGVAAGLVAGLCRGVQSPQLANWPRSAPPVVLHLSRADASLPCYFAAVAQAPPSPSSDSHPPPHAGDVAPPAAIFFTSGTSGRPKPVPVSDAQLAVQSRSKQNVLRLSRRTRFLHLSPLYHVGGFSSSHAITSVSGTHVFPPPTLHPSQQRHAAQLLSLLTAAHITLLVAVPTVLQLLVDAAAVAPAAAKAQLATFPSVRAVLYGGGRIPPTLRARVALVFPRARIVGAYGMTETASSITFLDHSLLTTPQQQYLHASSGWPAPHVELRISPPSTQPLGETHYGASESPSGVDVVGEVWTRGPHVMAGYLPLDDDNDGDDAANKANRARHTGITRDGWLRTGDLASVDPATGALYVRGRCGDVIRSGGETVLAPEVEAYLLSHNFVRDAAVVGMPHTVLGHAVVAAVELQRSAPILADIPDPDSVSSAVSQLRAACRSALASYKVPKWIIPVDSLPRNGTGKVMKREVMQIVRSHVEKATYNIQRAKL